MKKLRGLLAIILFFTAISGFYWGLFVATWLVNKASLYIYIPLYDIGKISRVGLFMVSYLMCFLVPCFLWAYVMAKISDENEMDTKIKELIEDCA